MGILHCQVLLRLLRGLSIAGVVEHLAGCVCDAGRSGLLAADHFAQAGIGRKLT